MSLLQKLRTIGRSRFDLAIVLTAITSGGIAAIWLSPPPVAEKIIERGVPMILGSLFTYFLVGRDIRKRQAAADTRLLSTVASMRRRLRSYVTSYLKENLDEVEILRTWSLCESEEDEKSAFPITRETLGPWIRSHVQLVSYIKAAISKLEQLRESALSDTTLAGSASPRVGAAFVEFASDFESSTRSRLWHMHRGVRGWDRLLVLMTVVPVDGGARAEISEAVSAIAEGLEEVHDGMLEVSRHYLGIEIATFRGMLPAWAQSQFDSEIALRDAEDDDETKAAVESLLRETDSPKSAAVENDSVGSS